MKPSNWEGNKREASPSRRFRSWFLATMLLVACSAGEQRPPPTPPSRSIVADVILTVENRMPRPLLVYLASSARSDSLGPVARGTTRSFSMPSLAGDSSTMLHLEARTDRSKAGILSQAFYIAAGQQVVWTLDGTRSVVTMR